MHMMIEKIFGLVVFLRACFGFPGISLASSRRDDGDVFLKYLRWRSHLGMGISAFFASFPTSARSYRQKNELRQS